MAEHHGDVRFEPTDVMIGPIVWFLAVLAGALAVIMFALWQMQTFEINRLPRTAAEGQTLPPEPRIEGLGLDRASHSVTNAELSSSARSQRIREEQMLNDGWTDAAGHKHPPIKLAFKRLIEEVAKNKQ